MWKDALRALDAHPAHIQPDGIVVVQLDPSERENIDLNVLRLYDERVYGNTLLWFFENVAPDDEAE
jgi:hypothetical protein